MVIDIDYDYFHRVADFANVIDAGNITARQFADVAQAIATWKDLDEGTKVTHAADDAVIDATDLSGSGASFNAGESTFCALGVGGRYNYRTVIIHIDRSAGVFLNRANVFSARTDQHTDLVRIDLGAEQTRRIATGFGAWTWDSGQHLAKDFHACFASLFERCTNDVFTNAIDLKVQLNTGHAFWRTSYLKVHIAKMIFVADDVSQQDPVLISVLDQANADTRHRVGQRNTSSHQTESRTANAGHRRRAIRFENVADHTNRVREIFVIRQYWRNAAFSQRTVTDLAATWATDRAAFANRKRWEVVIEHELLAVLFNQAIDALFVATGSKSHRYESLSFTALKNRRTVCARQHVGLALDRPQAGVIATIRTCPT